MKDLKKDSVTMKDGTEAWETASGRYYCRCEPDVTKWTKIVYYNLKKEHLPLAKGECSECKEVIESQYCGHFVRCKCGKSMCDTDRWTPEIHRYIGSLNPFGGHGTCV